MARYGRFANGEGTISKLSGNRRKPFLVQSKPILDLKSKKYKRQILGYATTYIEATKILYDFNSKQLDITKIHTTLNDFLIKFLEARKSETIAKTYQNYVSVIDTTISKIKDIEMHKLNYDILQNTLDSCSSRFFANVCKVVLSWCFEEAIKREIVKTNLVPMLVNNLKAKKRKAKTLFTQEEINLIWEEYNTQKTLHSTVYLLLLYSGCRVNEILKLTKDSVNLKESYFITGSKTDAGKNRTIPIHSKIKPIFEDLMKTKKDKLFYNNLNRVMTVVNFTGSYHSTIKSVNEKTSHFCRHTFISELQKLGVQVSKIKTIVGHAQSNVTDGVYTHYTVETLREVVEMIKY